MKFYYKSCPIEFVFLKFQYPPYPNKDNKRVVSVWQVTLNDEGSIIKKGSKKDIIEFSKRYVDELVGDILCFDDDDEDDEDEDEVTD